MLYARIKTLGPSRPPIDLTVDKKYKIIEEDLDVGFIIEDDVDYPIYCLWSGCAHLGGTGNWERIEEEDES